MKKLALFLFFILFSCSVFAQNGPAQPGISQIIDGSVTTAKLADGAVTLDKTTGFGTMATEAATDYVATGTYTAGLSVKMATDGSNATTIADLPVTLINGVAPMTAAEKTQALAEKVYSFDLGSSIAAAASVTVTITKATTAASTLAFEVKYCKTDNYGKPIYLTRRFVGILLEDGTVTVSASDTSQIGVGQYADTPLIEWINGTDGSELKIRTTAKGGEPDYPKGFVVQIIGGF